MAREPRRCRGCKSEFRPGLLTSKKYCRTCRKGALLTPAERGGGPSTTFRVAPWTDRTTMVRPTILGYTPLAASVVGTRAVALAVRNFPTPAEAEASRRAAVRFTVETAYQRAFVEALEPDGDGDGDTAPATGGGWHDVALAEVIDS